jgi:hypothetical protein
MSETIVRHIGGEPHEIIEAMLHALKLCGIDKLPGKGWLVSLSGKTVEAPLLHLALKLRIADAERVEREAHAQRAEELQATIDRLRTALKAKLPDQIEEVVDLLCDTAFTATAEREDVHRQFASLLDLYQREVRERRSDSAAGGKA